MRWYVLFLLLLSQVAALAEPGLVVEFRQKDKTDRLVLPYAALHVEATNAPSRFLEAGPFSAEFTGWISVELRAQYTFTVESSVGIELLVNGKQILNSDAAAASQTSASVRLNKGTNAFAFRMKMVAGGASSARVLWASRNNPVPVPIPAAVLSHTPDAGLQRSLAAHNGALVFEQFRCARCHIAEGAATLDAPALEGIGARLNADWMADWILRPAAQRRARMPEVFHGEGAAGKAQAVAAYLSSLGGSDTGTRGTRISELTDAMRAEGEALFQDLRCASCHTLPPEVPAENKMSLQHIGKKYRASALPQFLENPQAHYDFNPMPNFRLSSGEAQALSSFLLQRVPPGKGTEADPGLVAAGRELVQSRGCLNCHAANLPNNFKAPALATIMQGNLSDGCLDATSTKAPRFAFVDREKEEIQAFLAMRQTFPRTVPHESVIASTELLQCAQCHKDSGLPEPLALGGKLRPEWAATFIRGEVPYKPRPWIKTRMPAFPAYANRLADGLAAIHGYPPSTPAEQALDTEAAAIGAKLVSSAGGFSCVACHPVGSASSAVVVESPGVNLAYSGERLLRSYYHRWVMNPIAIDPGTKMPVYFDAEGRSQLTEFFDGNAAKQIDAIWHYLRMGPQMPPPPTP